ncbi:MAG: hypothetical protein ACD_13C00246G0004 [uncultured bacterium]|nr:MAG: hypothetical protein ACD_13C00246G0004 [uncultured bacterium]
MNHTRRKLLNAILFFAKNTRKLNTTKLSKLLFFLDFTHFKQTGYPSIGLQYHAFERGPVPKNFWLEIKDGRTPDDFRNALVIQVNNDTEQEYKELRFTAKATPDMRVFSPRERKILASLVEVYKDTPAYQLSEISHLKNSPWDKAYHGNGKNTLIEYKLALDAEASCDPDQAAAQLREFFAVEKNFSISPTK